MAGGDWNVKIIRPGTDWRKYELIGDTLAFWCWSDNELTELNSPLVFMQEPLGRGSDAFRLVAGKERSPARQWVRVKIPITRSNSLYRGTGDPIFDLSDAVSISFMQGLDDGAEHAVYVDDLMVIDSTASADTTPPAAPAGLTVRGYERQLYYGGACTECNAALGGYRAGRLLNLRKQPFVCPEPECLLWVVSTRSRS